MDETLERLVQFLNALQTFNDRLTEGQRELAKLRDHVSPHWQDTTRRRHDDLWNPLEEIVSHYVNLEGPGYLDFLRSKITALRGYLDG